MTTELLSLEQINNQYLFYESQRSCKNWLRGKGLSIIKLGKKYYVGRDEFMQVLQNLMSNNSMKKSSTKTIRQNPESEYEKAIYKNLIQKIDRLGD